LKARPVVVDAIIGVMSFSIIFLILLGCSISSFRLELLGLVARAVELGQENEQAITKHSIFTIVKLMLDQAAYLEKAWTYVGLISLGTLFVFSSLLAPIFQTLALLIMWYTPIKLTTRKRISNIIEILQAWQYLEVYLISVYIASWQLGDVSEFMLNQYCEDLSDFFSLMNFYGVLSASDSQCFYAMAKIEPGWYVLLFAALLLTVFTKLVIGASNQKMNDDEKVKGLCIGCVEGKVKLEKNTNNEKKKNLIKLIKPLPILFTERFHYLFITSKMSLTENRLNTDEASVAIHETREDLNQTITLSEETQIFPKAGEEVQDVCSGGLVDATGNQIL